jgi:hypothetical protein
MDRRPLQLHTLLTSFVVDAPSLLPDAVIVMVVGSIKKVRSGQILGMMESR